jgi:hypothetical protein
MEQPSMAAVNTATARRVGETSFSGTKLGGGSKAERQSDILETSEHYRLAEPFSSSVG